MLKRMTFFAYGVVCYLLFFGTFLYAVGFVGGFGVPTRLDGPATDGPGFALAINAALLALFAVQHSVMARPWFKRRWTRVVPKPIERSTYVLFSSLALILLFWQWRPMGGIVWTVENSAYASAIYALFTFGWGLVLCSTFLIDHFDLFGLRQVWLHLLGQPYTPRPFVTPGPYRMVRHPLYAGWLFAFWMTPTMTLAHLVFAVATTTYILLAIRFEEHDLVQEHGAAYERYRAQVPMLLPLLARQNRDGAERRTAATADLHR
jgi:protein-S-isoprenylcysteine O-methyltransferase Ste14